LKKKINRNKHDKGNGVGKKKEIREVNFLLKKMSVAAGQIPPSHLEFPHHHNYLV